MPHRHRLLAAILVGMFACVLSADAQDVPVVEPEAAAHEEAPLQFAFDRTPWREVLQWLADEANLALHINALPTGSFTYSDSNSFTHQEAINRVNLFLLPQGFSLVRSGRLLSVISLGDPQGMRQLDAIAKLVSAGQLDQLQSHNVVKCIFPLGELQAEDAVEELAALKLMTQPAVFARTNRLMITDTVAKLKAVRTIIDAFEPSGLDNGTVMESFRLEHADAEDILTVARPHLSLATGEMIGIDVSLSADLLGKNIFVTGVADKVKLIEGLIESMDVPDKSAATDGEAVLRSHRVAGGNVSTVYNVLITLLAGKSARLSMDEATSSVIALAAPDIQEQITQTVEQLQAADIVFAVIQLKTIDPYFAISLLDEMLVPPEPVGDLVVSVPYSEGRRDDRDRDDRRRSYRSYDMPAKFDGPTVKPPKIDADPATKRLFVHGTQYQIDQIKEIIAELETTPDVDSNENLRVLSLSAKRAERVLNTAARFWRKANPIIYYPAPQETEAAVTERVVNGESSTSQPEYRRSVVPVPRYLTDNLRSQAPAIRCQITQRGLLLQSDDTEALDEFEGHLRAITGSADSAASPPIVFYLKHAKPEDAIRMLAELLDGGEAAAFAQSGSLVNGYVSSGSFLGSLVTAIPGEAMSNTKGLLARVYYANQGVK